MLCPIQKVEIQSFDIDKIYSEETIKFVNEIKKKERYLNSLTL